MAKLYIDTTNINQTYWEKILIRLGLNMNKGSMRNDPKQKYAIAEYLENLESPPVNETEVKHGFETISPEPESE
jgi:hypothetical protein